MVRIIVDVESVGCPILSVEDEPLKRPVGVVHLKDFTWTGDDDGPDLGRSDRNGSVGGAGGLSGKVLLVGARRDDDPIPRCCLFKTAWIDAPAATWISAACVLRTRDRRSMTALRSGTPIRSPG